MECDAGGWAAAFSPFLFVGYNGRMSVTEIKGGVGEMETAVWSREEVALRGKALYEQSIRREVENAGNIGRMVIIDVETGDYEVDEMGITSAERLHAKRPNARLYGIRIGYNAAEALGGVLERTVA